MYFSNFLKRLVFKSFAVFVGSLGCNLSVTVFFYKSSVTHIVTVGSFETLTVFIFFYARSLALTFVIGTLESSTISIMNHDITINQTVLELTFKHVAVLLGQFAPAVLQIIPPVAYIDIAILPDEGTLTGTQAILKLSVILGTLCRAEDAYTRAFSLHIIAFINVAIMKFIDTLSVLDIILPVADIHIAISIFESTFPERWLSSH